LASVSAAFSSKAGSAGGAQHALVVSSASAVGSLAYSARVAQPADPSLPSRLSALERFSIPGFFLSAASFSPVTKKKLAATSLASAARSFFWATSPSCLRNATKAGSATRYRQLDGDWLVGLGRRQCRGGGWPGAGCCAGAAGCCASSEVAASAPAVRNAAAASMVKPKRLVRISFSRMRALDEQQIEAKAGPVSARSNGGPARAAVVPDIPQR